MAGPALTGIRNVDNPYEGLQKAVSEAGSIYNDFRKSTQETAAHNARMLESQQATGIYDKHMEEQARLEGQRAFLQGYDPNLGIEGRGISAEANRFADQEEANIDRFYTDARNRGEAVPSQEEINAQKMAARKGLIEQETARNLIFDDLIRKGGLTVAEADAAAAARTSHYGSRAAMLAREEAREEARVSAYNKRVADDVANVREYLKVVADVNRSNNTGISSGGGSRSSTGAGKDAYKGSGVSIADEERFTKFLEGHIGGWPMDFDTPKAVNNILTGYDEYNRKREELGIRPLPLSALESFITRNTERGSTLDNTFKFDTAGKVEAELKNRFDKDPNFGVSVSGAGNNAITRDRMAIDPTLQDRALNNTAIAPRSMTELEKQRVQQLYGSILPSRNTPAPVQRATPTRTPVVNNVISTNTVGTAVPDGNTASSNTVLSIPELLTRRDDLISRQQTQTEQRNTDNTNTNSSTSNTSTTSTTAPSSTQSLPVPKTAREVQAFTLAEEAAAKLDRRKELERIVNSGLSRTARQEDRDAARQATQELETLNQDIASDHTAIAKLREDDSTFDKLYRSRLSAVSAANRKAAQERYSAGVESRKNEQQLMKDVEADVKEIASIRKSLSNNNLSPTMKQVLIERLRVLTPPKPNATTRVEDMIIDRQRPWRQ